MSVARSIPGGETGLDRCVLREGLSDCGRSRLVFIVEMTAGGSSKQEESDRRGGGQDHQMCQEHLG